MDTFKKRLRFNDHDDLLLLREVLGQNPLNKPQLWKVIQENLVSNTGKEFSLRTLKGHLERLIKLWLERNKVLQNKSGIEEEVTEKDNLCHEIYEIMKESKQLKRPKDVKQVKEEGENARDKWTLELEESRNPSPQVVEYDGIVHDHTYIPGLTEDEVSDVGGNEEVQTVKKQVRVTVPSEFARAGPSGASQTPHRVLGTVRSRKRKINAQRQGMEYLEAYDKQQFELKKKELELQERQLLLEESKMKLAEFEVRKKMELQEKQVEMQHEVTRSLLAVIDRQEKMINMVVNQFSKNN